jgi:cytochrome c oxidase cbb3-type subunit 3
VTAVKTVLLTIVVVVAAAGCRREERDVRPAPPFATEGRYYEEYEDNAYALSEGKKLFSFYNCSGCHANGAGGMGPALLDDRWFYGFEPEQIFDTISLGRSGGMPAFGGTAREPGITVVGQVPAYQRWELVAYVRSLSGLAPSNAATGRDDHMQRRMPENSTNPRKPYVEPPPPDVVEPKK